MLNQLTDLGRSFCERIGIDPRQALRPSLEHQYWLSKMAEHYEEMGYEVLREFPLETGGIIDLVAQRPGERIAIEVETGKSDINKNISKLRGADFDRCILMATSPEAVEACRKAIRATASAEFPVELMTWLDIS